MKTSTNIELSGEINNMEIYKVLADSLLLFVSASSSLILYSDSICCYPSTATTFTVQALSCSPGVGAYYLASGSRGTHYLAWSRNERDYPLKSVAMGF